MLRTPARFVFNTLTAASLALCVVACAAWVSSYHGPAATAAAAPSELPPGRWRVESRRGQVLLAYHRANPERPHFWTTVFVPAGGVADGGALVRVAAFDPASPVDPDTRLPRDLLSRDYVATPGAGGVRPGNGGGFALSATRVPAAAGPRVGPVLWVAAVPHWLLALLAAPAPEAMRPVPRVRDRRRRRGRVRLVPRSPRGGRPFLAAGRRQRG